MASRINRFKEDDGKSIVTKMQKFILESDEFIDFMDTWCHEHAQNVQWRVSENKLDYTFLYRDFLRDLENKITDFIDRQGSSIERVYAELDGAPQDSDLHVFAQIFNAMIDFDIFIQMMRDTAQKMYKEREETRSLS